jgi:hypothetical protein
MIYCDNQSSIKLLEKPGFRERLKHIDIKYHFIRDMVQKGVVQVQYISTNEKIANILTKNLSREQFIYFGYKLGVVQNVSLVEREC